MTGPSVSILLPVRNEGADIDRCLGSLEAQDYEGPWEIVVAEGRSDDDTADRLRAWTGRVPLVVVDNPDAVQSAGLNRAAAAASGEVLVRADGHTVYPPDYIRSNVAALLETGAAAVGGHMRPEGDTPFARAVAAAMRTPLAIGPGRFHRAGVSGPVDTVYLGAFRRSDFERLGPYRTYPSRVAEDADLYQRFRAAEAQVWLDPRIRSSYRPRRTPGALWRQAYRWGLGKAEMWYTAGKLPSRRPLIPLALVVGLAAGVVAGLAWSWLPLAALVAAWAVVLVAAAVHGRHGGVIVAGAIMHLAYGLGLAVGLVRGKRRALPKVLGASLR